MLAKSSEACHVVVRSEPIILYWGTPQFVCDWRKWKAFLAHVFPAIAIGQVMECACLIACPTQITPSTDRTKESQTEPIGHNTARIFILHNTQTGLTQASSLFSISLFLSSISNSPTHSASSLSKYHSLRPSGSCYIHPLHSLSPPILLLPHWFTLLSFSLLFHPEHLSLSNAVSLFKTFWYSVFQMDLLVLWSISIVSPSDEVEHCNLSPCKAQLCPSGMSTARLGPLTPPRCLHQCTFLETKKHPVLAHGEVLVGGRTWLVAEDYGPPGFHIVLVAHLSEVYHLSLVRSPSCSHFLSLSLRSDTSQLSCALQFGHRRLEV